MTPQHSFTPTPPPRHPALRPSRRPVSESSCDAIAEALADPAGLDVELLLRTHLSVVVRVRLEGLAGSAPQEGSLVIPRLGCVGDRPTGPALLAAAQQLICRQSFSASQHPDCPSRLLVRLGGRWLTLVDGHPPVLPAALLRKELQ
jgi:hypothetical protein